MKRSQNTKRMTGARRGFTLIELLIVLAILVLLATLVAPRLLGSREKANVDAAKTQIALFKSALEIYSLHMSGYPATEQGLMALIERPSSTSRGGDVGEGDGFGVDDDLTGFGVDDEEEAFEEEEDGGNSSWQGPYIKAGKAPKDPWGSPYRYEYPGPNNTIGEPDIWSIGPDRKDNTKDDIVSWSGQGRRGGGTDGRGQPNSDDVQGFDTTPDDTGSERPIDLNE